MGEFPCGWILAARESPVWHQPNMTRTRVSVSDHHNHKPTMKFLAIITSLALLLPSATSAMILVKIPGMGDPSLTLEGYNDGQWFVADSFTFGVEREMKESGEKAGTEDINIGLGELQECTISKSMDRASAKLAQFAINGNFPGGQESSWPF